MNSLIDTHCHLNHPNLLHDLPNVLHRAELAGVDRFICVGYDLESSQVAVKLAGDTKKIRAAVGVHPHDAETFGKETEELIRRLAFDYDVVAIGETGLDYYRNLSPKDAQKDVFRRHISLAKELNLPLIIHSRDAQEDVLEILREEGMPSRGVVMHCCPADIEFARNSVEMGCYIGVAGPITFTNAEMQRSTAKTIPVDRILLETDCPYLSPHPHRGKRNEPSYLPLIAGKVAEVMGKGLSEIADATSSNARELFDI